MVKIIEPSVEIFTPLNGTEILKHLERCARNCYKSEDKITDESAPKMIKKLIDLGHEAMIEHTLAASPSIVSYGTVSDGLPSGITFTDGKFSGTATLQDTDFDGQESKVYTVTVPITAEGTTGKTATVKIIVNKTIPDLNKATVSIKTGQSYIYNGRKKEAVEVKVNDVTLREDIHYTITYTWKKNEDQKIILEKKEVRLQDQTKPMMRFMAENGGSLSHLQKGDVLRLTLLNTESYSDDHFTDIQINGKKMDADQIHKDALHNEYVLITLKDKETKIVASAEDKSGNTAEIQQTFTLEETNFYGYWLLVIPGLLGSLGLFWKVKHGKTKGS